jgi:hypothetical protein
MQVLLYGGLRGKWMHFDEIVLALIVAVSAVAVAWFLWGRYAAIRLTVPEDSTSSAEQGRGDDNSEHSLRKVGTLVTALMHANEGWQHFSTESLLEGVDAVFVRKRGGRNQFEVRIVATTCARGDDPTAGYNTDHMTNAAVIEQLERLKGITREAEGDITGQTIDAIVKAIKRGSVRVSKHLYAHMLGNGKTTVYSIGREGQLLEAPTRAKLVSGTSHRLMVQTLANGLRQPAAAAAAT